MKRVYGRFCSRHNEAVNFHKDLLTKDKRFKAFIKVSVRLLSRIYQVSVTQQTNFPEKSLFMLFDENTFFFRMSGFPDTIVFVE